MREDLQLILLNHLNVVQNICNRKFDRNVNNKDNYVEFMKPIGYQKNKT